MNIIEALHSRKTALKVTVAVSLLAGAFAAGRWTGHPVSVETELRHAQDRLEYLFANEGDFRQAHLTTVSAYIRQLADMELYWISLRIWNQPDYGKIEKDYMQDEQAWEKRLQDEASKPSEYEGGSMAPMDCNMRLAAMINQRIDDVKNKWLK